MRNPVELNMGADTTVGFILNPVAGVGGKVGLKGSDDVADRALALGATPIAPARALFALRRFQHLQAQSPPQRPVKWFTCGGVMGADVLEAAGVKDYTVVYSAAAQTTRQDTVEASRCLRDADVDLILFCGGDGTARDISQVVDTAVPVLGIPSGVKMYSGVFACSVEDTADLLIRFLRNEVGSAEVDILDLDEVAFRNDEWQVRLYQKARTPFEPSLTQSAKAVVDEQDDSMVKEEIAAFLAEQMRTHPERLYLMGPGSTVQAIAGKLGVRKTLLGIDALVDGKIIQHDVNETQILALLEIHQSRWMVLSPIGAQGFVLGRGNLPFSPEVVRRVGVENITLVATPAKLATLDCLRFDTGDCKLNAALAGDGFRQVTVGDHRHRMVACRD